MAVRAEESRIKQHFDALSREIQEELIRAIEYNPRKAEIETVHQETMKKAAEPTPYSSVEPTPRVSVSGRRDTSVQPR